MKTTDEQKAKMKMDHMRGMTSEEVAVHTLRSIELGRNEVSLTANGKLMSFVSRFFPRLADRIAKRKVIALFKEEMAQRRLKRQELKKQQVECTSPPIFRGIAFVSYFKLFQPLDYWRENI